MMTLHSGACSMICSQASMPVPPGMRMSMTTTSGRRSRVLITASSAVLASPIDFKIGVVVQQGP